MKNSLQHLSELVNPMSYSKYQRFVISLVNEGKTTGPEQSEDKIAYTKLNLQRSKRVEKQFKIDQNLAQELAQLKQNWNWLILTEAWCGDGAQQVGAIAAIAETSPFISVTILLRDENPDLMAKHLTNGSQSIPKLISTHAETGQVLFTWGPRPAAIQQKVVTYKAQNPTATKEDLHLQLAAWYARDKSTSLQNDLLDLIKYALFSQVFPVAEAIAS